MMINLSKNKKILLVLLIIFGISFAITAKAVRCEDAKNPDACSALRDSQGRAKCQWGTAREEGRMVEKCCKALEISWPKSPGGTQLTSCSSLIVLVQYLYEWGIALGGLAAFFALVIAGFQYLTSAGDPTKMKVAKDRIFSAVLGLVLLLSSFLILNTLNPELTTLSPPTTDIGELGFFARRPTGWHQPCEWIEVYQEKGYEDLYRVFLSEEIYWGKETEEGIAACRDYCTGTNYPFGCTYTEDVCLEACEKEGVAACREACKEGITSIRCEEGCLAACDKKSPSKSKISDEECCEQYNCCCDKDGCQNKDEDDCMCLPLEECLKTGEGGWFVIDWEHKIGSIKMKGACQVNLYEESNCKGPFTAVAKSHANLEWLGQDRIYSIKALDIAPPTLPEVRTIDHSGPEKSKGKTTWEVELRGELEDMGRADVAYVFFEYGENKVYLDKIAPKEFKEVFREGEFPIFIEGLKPSTTYYYRAGARNIAGTSFGEDYPEEEGEEYRFKSFITGE